MCAVVAFVCPLVPSFLLFPFFVLSRGQPAHQVPQHGLVERCRRPRRQGEGKRDFRLPPFLRCLASCALSSSPSFSFDVLVGKEKVRETFVSPLFCDVCPRVHSRPLLSLFASLFCLEDNLLTESPNMGWWNGVDVLLGKEKAREKHFALASPFPPCTGFGFFALCPLPGSRFFVLQAISASSHLLRYPFGRFNSSLAKSLSPAYNRVLWNRECSLLPFSRRLYTQKWRHFGACSLIILPLGRLLAPQ